MHLSQSFAFALMHLFDRRFLPARRRTAGCLLLALLAGCGELPTQQVAGGRPEQGRQLIERYGCVACHAIPGVSGQAGRIGPPLSHLAERGYIAGVLPNTPQALVRWLRDPPAVDPLTAMPRLGLSEAQAVDIAAYLYATE